MRVFGMAVVALVLMVPVRAAESGQLSRSEDEKAILDAVGGGFQLREFVVEGRNPGLEALDEFLDLSEFDSHPQADGWRWFDVPYKTTRVTVHVGLGDKGATLWVRLDLASVRSGALQRTALLTRLNTKRPLTQGDYRMAGDGLVSLYLGLDTRTVSEGDVRRAIATLIEQAARSYGVWGSYINLGDALSPARSAR